ncbi:hypothetical protein [Paenisporosarcina antarctica]|uniref:hypothetical protein n=1 Tax=Paenisporosarcina antarctica TaxID=417367 RepID=UPI00141707DE|nr:hypothetical protein [Paenisporosarcina antarctica]
MLIFEENGNWSIRGNALLILLLEKAGVNEIKAHFSLGILLIVSGLLIDFVFVQ